MALFGWNREAERVKASTVGGVDLGGTKIAAAVIGPDNGIISSAKRPTPTKGEPVDVAEAVAATMREAADAAGITTSELGGVGVGFPGSVERSKGLASRAGNLPGWEGDFELGPFLQERLETGVKLGNDVQVGTMAEYELGAGRGFDSVLGVFWGAFTEKEPAANRENVEQLFSWALAGKLRVHIGATTDLGGAPAAIRAIAERKAEGKIVVRP